MPRPLLNTEHMIASKWHKEGDDSGTADECSSGQQEGRKKRQMLLVVVRVVDLGIIGFYFGDTLMQRQWRCIVLSANDCGGSGRRGDVFGGCS